MVADPFHLAEPLEEIAKALYSGSTESTLAVALTTEKQLIMANKSGSVDMERAIALANQILSPVLDYYRFEEWNVVPVQTPGEQSGKHAEMLIWSNYPNLLAVAASQAVCTDCGGFLNQKGIAHPGCSPDDGRKMWWDPVENVTFTGNALTGNDPTLTYGT